MFEEATDSGSLYWEVLGDKEKSAREQHMARFPRAAIDGDLSVEEYYILTTQKSTPANMRVTLKVKF